MSSIFLGSRFAAPGAEGSEGSKGSEGKVAAPPQYIGRLSAAVVGGHKMI
jgi:hypothetical protein